MTVTLSPSDGPALDPRTDLGVQIKMLPPRVDVAASLRCDPSHPSVLTTAAQLAGPSKKTDIIVFDHKPWHMVKGVLLPHPQAHVIDKETILQVSFKLQQRATWWSAEPFTIESIARSDDHPAVAGSPDSPFDGPPPPYRGAPAPAITSGAVYCVRAAPIVSAAIGQMYKIAFTIGGELIDPDMEGVP